MDVKKSLARILVPLVSWALVLQAVPPVLAANPADESEHFKSIPHNAFAIVHVRNLPKTLSDIEGSVIFKALNEFLESKPFQKIRQEDEEVGIVTDMCLSMMKGLPKVLTGEFTFAFIDFDDEEYEPGIVFLADADERELGKLIEKTLSPAVTKLTGEKIIIETAGRLKRIGTEDSEEGLFYKMAGKTMMLSPFKRTFDSVDNVRHSLARNALFRSAIEKHREPSDLLGFLNVREIGNFAGRDDEETQAMLKATGFGSIDTISLTARSMENGSFEEMTFFAHQGLSGAIKLMNRPGDGPGFEKYVPVDYTGFIRLSAGNFAEVYKELRATIKHVIEAAWFLEDLDEELARLEKDLGFSIGKDLLPTLGGNIGYAIKAPRVAGFPEMAAFVEVRDREKLEKLISSIIPDEIAFAKTRYKNVTIHTTTVQVVQPSYAFVGDYLVATPSPAVLRDIIDTGLNGKSILTKEDYRKVYAHLPEKGVLTLSGDIEEGANSIVPLALAAWGGIEVEVKPPAEPDADDEDAIDEEEFVPEGDLSTQAWRAFAMALQKHAQGVTGFGAVVIADKDSIQIKSFSGTGMSGLMLPAMGVGFFMPVIFFRQAHGRRHLEIREDVEFDF